MNWLNKGKVLPWLNKGMGFPWLNKKGMGFPWLNKGLINTHRSIGPLTVPENILSSILVRRLFLWRYLEREHTHTHTQECNRHTSITVIILIAQKHLIFSPLSEATLTSDGSDLILSVVLN